LTVEVLSALFRRLLLEMLVAAHDAGRLQFFGAHAVIVATTSSVNVRRATSIIAVTRGGAPPARSEKKSSIRQFSPV
jgi:hypothetical protein